jgi:four helix bundle protein
MHIPLRQPLLDEVLRVIELVRPLAAAIARRDRNLASQVRRALSGVALNLYEGFGSASGNARLRFECALGSLYETRTGLRVAVAWGYLSPEATAASLEALDHVGGRVFGLVRR